MKKTLLKTLFLSSTMLLSSCGGIFFEATPKLSINKVDIEMHVTEFIKYDGFGKWSGYLACPYVRSETREYAESCPHVLDANEYKFKFNVTHEVAYLSFRYLDENYEPIYKKETASDEQTNGLNKKNWYNDPNAPTYGKAFDDYEYEKDKLIINHPTEDYKYVVVYGKVSFKNSHERGMRFTFVIEK